MTPTPEQRADWRRLADGPDAWDLDATEFIAAAREAVPALLDALEHAEAGLRVMSDEHSRDRKDWHAERAELRARVAKLEAKEGSANIAWGLYAEAEARVAKLEAVADAAREVADQTRMRTNGFGYAEWCHPELRQALAALDQEET